jgi:hypothetical protein
MKFFNTISIIKSWDVKFVMYVRWKINGNFKKSYQNNKKSQKNLLHI